MTDESGLVALIGQAGRFPGAADLREFWANLVAGVESRDPMPAADQFDAEFFGYSAGEALLLDPQQRVFLECAWEALEDAGYDPARYPGTIGIYAGSSETGYASALYAHRDRLPFVDGWQIRLATGLDFLTTRTAYKLGTRGPAVTVQTACSTSLVAVHLATQALLGGECDLALAGGVTVHLDSGDTDEGNEGLVSPDGHCRPFDAAARGTVFTNGVGVVVLKRLTDAGADGDDIRAVIRGSAVNNDGADKIGFAAPSVSGQARVIRDAHLAAGASPDSVSYVEAHGTGTPLGDPIEVAALTKAFRRGTAGKGFCAIGSVKSNIGHTDAAAGVAGLIKTVLALRHGLLPASLFFDTPNPEIDFEQSPFRVNQAPREWRRNGRPRRAGVSALGIGGTNAHVVLQEAPPAPPAGPARPWQLLVVSARTGPALDAAAGRLAAHLGQLAPDVPLADVAWTLQTGRRAQPYRWFGVCADRAGAVRALTGDRSLTGAVATTGPVAFGFPGQGGQHVGMGRDLYQHEPEFRERVDECAELAGPSLGFDLREVLYPDPADRAAAEAAARRLDEMSVGQPAVFAIEYALARLWLHWGVRPDAVVGHSLGAYAAACVAGVFSLPDALDLVVARGRLLQRVPAGAMLAVPLPQSEVAPLLDAGCSVAVVNGPAQCVVAGPSAAVARLRRRLRDREVDARRLRIAVPAHSPYVAPIVAEFEDRVRALPLRPPAIPLISETTGRALSDAEATSPGYWSAHLRQPVQFGRALQTLFQEPRRVVLEVGPGQALTSIVRHHPGRPVGVTVAPSLPHPSERAPELVTMLTAAGRLWLAGAPIDWPALHDGQHRRRVPLPTYPFQRRRYAVGPPGASAPSTPEAAAPGHPAPVASTPVASTPVLSTPEAAAPGQPTPASQVRPAAPARTADQAEPAGPDEPAGHLEARLAAILARVLGLARIGRHDSFFALGGDSLMAAQVSRSVRHEFHVRLPLRVVFQNPTPAELAPHLEKLLATLTEKEAPGP